jgi:hypothetical protein
MRFDRTSNTSNKNKEELEFTKYQTPSKHKSLVGTTALQIRDLATHQYYVAGTTPQIFVLIHNSLFMGQLHHRTNHTKTTSNKLLFVCSSLYFIKPDIINHHNNPPLVHHPACLEIWKSICAVSAKATRNGNGNGNGNSGCFGFLSGGKKVGNGNGNGNNGNNGNNGHGHGKGKD